MSENQIEITFPKPIRCSVCGNMLTAMISGVRQPELYVSCFRCHTDQKFTECTEIRSGGQYAAVAEHYLCVWMERRRGRVYDLNAFVMRNIDGIIRLKKTHPLYQLVELADPIVKMGVWTADGARKREAEARRKRTE